MKSIINKFLARHNYVIKRIVPKNPEQYFLNHLDDNLNARRTMFIHYGVNVLLDVGANIGQYAMLMRRLEYKGKIVSFEPLSSAFAELKSNAEKDGNWLCENIAIGSRNEVNEIHISGNSYSSSLLDILPSHIAFDSESQYVGKESIQVKRLDDIFGNYCNEGNVVMMKIDTQGYERSVLEGAAESLKKIKLLQLEMSIEPLYKNETLFPEMLGFIYQYGFELFGLENGIRDEKSGKLLQVDGIFINKTL